MSSPSTDRIRLAPVERISITVLVDNIADLLLPSDEVVRRSSLLSGPTRPVSVFEGPGPDAVRAEHGYSALVAVEVGGAVHRVLFDTGISPDGMVENMRRLDVDPKGVEAVVMSHGHLDHTGGLGGFIDAVGRANVPLLLHPDFWLRRRIAVPGADPIEIPTPSRRALEDGGFEIVEDVRPSFLLDDALLVTGEITRTTDFEKGFAPHQAHRDGAWVPDPWIRDDQAIVLHLAGRGLVVLTGCGHAGIVNIVRHAQLLTGVDRVHAIAGGFHLGGGLFEPIIGDTVAGLAAVEPDILVPGHCTGWRAQQALAMAMPDAYVHPSVGTRLELAAA